MMFGGYETIEAYEDDLYREESSSELSVDSEVEFQLYSQVHYAQDLGNIIREEECEEKNPGNSESSTSKPNQKNLIVLSDSEVIQLSDGSEVITLSDEDSIYKYKGKNIGVQAQDKVQGPSASVRSNELADEECKRDIEKTKPKERSGIIREVMIIEVSSSEEEESSISESDNVESWMLLGSEEDDKDDDILLNLVGCGDSVTEGEDGVNWFISEKDIEAQIANNRSPRRLAQRYYSDYKNVICRNCDKRGHLSKNCPLPQKVRPCFLCSERGHLLYSCPAAHCINCPLPKKLGHRCLFRYSWSKQCDRCHMQGHYTDACPEIWRQYHLTTKPGPPIKPKTPSRPSALVYCYLCAQKGHYGHECTEKNEYEEYVVSPFISYYDDKDEIQEREKRLKREIKVLKKNGHIPMSLKVPFMETADKNTYHNWRKRYLLWKNIMWPQEDKKMKNRNRDHEKHRRGERHHDVDDDFPRGPKTHSPSGRIKTQKAHKSFHHSSSNHKSRDDKLSKAGKQGKRKKKEKYLGNDSNDNLFLIKQRKKKF
ncbi:zinc finger CCHC domain-containing protein 7 isoform X1 [Nycticebus coucang]|uniref:zinc finger CCHC domain-containing protein 7 isoform X1 n=1 Tax=Nycticebus coucang TaxID=9470 RepID=UPI00234DC39A|nr:zinc finger CCHC domain-containing protein 7 isoform X1 [Nycticebus coucang]XP_053424622.1 zinc finger CCHC domain-containing protein 7 isoform X1 [Nycticebus coucang]XP_053424623.1 zinc finger CCHC domain-containing protein 7 isoform X1 [Nycticebus coucang]XP_053424632.1 zinc finger CCHC domain-containing protein 7 isoform X1 [Nycticebus coucang]XP_053424640.1 zinc finger CCHC domain-containing protein 7 isoform X1 [Nycticebus coucang]